MSYKIVGVKEDGTAVYGKKKCRNGLHALITLGILFTVPQFTIFYLGFWLLMWLDTKR